MSVGIFSRPRAAPYDTGNKRKRSLNWRALAAILINFAIWAAVIYAAH